MTDKFKQDKHTKQVLDYIKAGKNLFVTGKAGTGKTMLLQKIVEIYSEKKTLAVLAPTGVAAEHSNGVTMHSFLRLPLTPYLPRHRYSSLYSLDDHSIEVVKKLDMIIIDEISMVRCDMLDAADMILRHYRNNRKPFGGIQLIMFGDLYQLMPVTKSEDWEVLKSHYRSSYFFCSEVLQKMEYYVLSLEKVHRQNDRSFINLLNSIRLGKIKAKDIDYLNTRYEPDFHANIDDKIVMLKVKNNQTDSYNEEQLFKLKGAKKECWAVDDNWSPEKYPTSFKLVLKKGARVMFVKNDTQYGQYINGTMGYVVGFSDNYIKVKRDDNDRVILVEKQTWDRLSYRINKKTKTIETEVVGSFKQYPLKLAWAVTIHKSQGLTFDEVAIDAAKSFTYGQVYVALSRCRTMEGMHLTSKIPSQKIKADPLVKAYLSSIDDENRALPIQDIEEDTEYEDSPLSLWISERKYWNIKDGTAHKYSHSVEDERYAEKIFKTKNGRLIINDTFKGRGKKFSLFDMNGGNCPFIPRKYKTVIFNNEYHTSLKVEIVSDIEIRQGTDAYDCDSWIFEIRLGKILK